MSSLKNYPDKAMSRWSQMFANSVYFDIVRLWSLESQPAGLSLASYSSVRSHWKQTFYITNSVKCTWTVHWVILTERCAQRFQKYGRHLPYPAPGFFSCFLDLIASPIDSFIFFWQPVFKVAVLQLRLSRGWGTCQDSCLQVLFCLFHKSVMVLPVFSSWSAGTLLLEAFPGALWQCWARCAPRQPLVLAGAWDSAHGPVWIRPLVFFGLFLWLSRSFWILSLPAGYLHSLVAFHYINKFTVYYLVSARLGPYSVLYPVCTSGGSLFFLF